MYFILFRKKITILSFLTPYTVICTILNVKCEIRSIADYIWRCTFICWYSYVIVDEFLPSVSLISDAFYVIKWLYRLNNWSNEGMWQVKRHCYKVTQERYIFGTQCMIVNRPFAVQKHVNGQKYFMECFTVMFCSDLNV